VGDGDVVMFGDVGSRNVIRYKIIYRNNVGY
jgi:hypothetical protein